MGALTAVRNKITSWLTNNNQKDITGPQMNEIATDILDIIFSAITDDMQLPYFDESAEKFKGTPDLIWNNGTKILKPKKLQLGVGSYADQIYTRGPLTDVQRRFAIATMFAVKQNNTVIGTISSQTTLSNLKVGQVVTLDGGIQHTLAEGETILLKGQTDPAENLPYTAVSEVDDPEVAGWYEAAVNQIITILKGTNPSLFMPATGEGENPEVIEVSSADGSLALQLFELNNF